MSDRIIKSPSAISTRSHQWNLKFVVTLVDIVHQHQATHGGISRCRRNIRLHIPTELRLVVGAFDADGRDLLDTFGAASVNHFVGKGARGYFCQTQLLDVLGLNIKTAIGPDSDCNVLYSPVAIVVGIGQLDCKDVINKRRVAIDFGN